MPTRPQVYLRLFFFGGGALEKIGKILKILEKMDKILKKWKIHRLEPRETLKTLI